MTDNPLELRVCQTLGASAILRVQTIQTLWSGCGRVARVWLDGQGETARGNDLRDDGVEACGETVVIKHVQMPEAIDHPRGWDTDRSAERKARSYEVETLWYVQWAGRCTAGCRVPRYLGHAHWDDERLLILEDIDASGFDQRHADISVEQIDACIHWLAAFHAAFLGERPSGLWEKGTYWHLDTRPDEYDALEDGPLKRVAPLIDQALDGSRYQTIVHGDAKPANFCFSASGRVAAVDFQYVGGGCGMKDLAYFVGGCQDADACFEWESHVLETYFAAFKHALHERGSAIDSTQLEADWRRLYPYAWADFERFLRGWSPGHWKISAYSQHMTERVLGELGGR